MYKRPGEGVQSCVFNAARWVSPWWSMTFFTSVQRAFIFSRVGKNKIKNPTKLPCVET
jgi:hypothetical protein